MHSDTNERTPKWMINLNYHMVVMDGAMAILIKRFTLGHSYIIWPSMFDTAYINIYRSNSLDKYTNLFSNNNLNISDYFV